MRKNSIDELLEDSKENYQVISSYRKISKPKVKTILEHLRSALEYVAQDINDKSDKPKSKIYFPYGFKDEFEKSVAKYFPKLKLDFPEIYLDIESLQPFVSNDEWLVLLCKLTNNVKHNSEIDVRSESFEESMSVSAGGCNLVHADDSSQIFWSGNMVNGKLVDDFIYDRGNLIITKKGKYL